MEAARRATELDPSLAEAHCELGLALLDTGARAAAIESLRRAVSLDPRRAALHLALGTAQFRQALLDDAAASFRAALERDPASPEAHASLANVLLQQGEVEPAVAALERALSLAPDLYAARSNLLFALHYRDARSPDAVFEAHRTWARVHADPVSAHPVARPASRLDPDRPLRVGYVSADLRNHSVARFFEPLLTHRERRAFSVTCFSNVAREDDVTQRLRALSDAWIHVRGMSDEDLAARIASERIDVLVDLGGHSGDGRLLVFARRPAPVQVTYLGYPNTTGLSQMDARITDAWADPPGDADRLCSEALVRLPECAWCYTPGEDAAPMPDPPARRNGFVTFGSFNNYTKVGPEVLAAWARILLGTPGSRLLLKAKSLADATVARRVRATLRAAGIADDRVDVRGWEPGRGEHLRLFDALDVSLDTFPYHGTTTTCDALWMGVPVVVRAGQTHASRVGRSLLHAVGLDELVHSTVDAYVACATALARDIDRLTLLRRSLRGRMLASPLGDPRRFVPDYELALRALWRSHCARA